MHRKTLSGRTIELIEDAEKLFPARHPNGTLPRSAHPDCSEYGSLFRTAEDAGLPIIPRAEWPERMADMDAQKMWPADWISWAPKNQQATNFCWANGPCGAAELVRVIQGLPYVEMSSASVCCKVNGYVNRGGYGLDAMNYMQQVGPCSTDLWPNVAIDRSYDTAASRAQRESLITFEFVDLPTTFDAVVSALLCGFPCPVGYDWWGHEVFAVAADAISRTEFALVIRNSWGIWGEKYNGQSGFAWLSEKKGTPDDAQAVRAVTAATAATAA